MMDWKGPLVAVVVAAALFRFAPGREVCAVPEVVVETPPPAPVDLSRLGVGGGSSEPQTQSAPDPFALGPAPAESGPRQAPVRSAAVPARPWRLTGIVGGRSAVLTRADGSSVVVTTGQRVDSARVLGITVLGVELEDRGGRFLLKVR